MNYFKLIVFTAIFALTLNAATAQKHTGRIEQAQQAESMKAKENPRETMSRWVYTVALVTENDGKFEIKFMEGKSDLTRRMMHITEERQKKTMEEAGEIHSEVDLINFLNQMNFELISVVGDPENEAMKYYLRQKIR